MSSPSQRRTRNSQSATPRRSARTSQAPQSSPANGSAPSQAVSTPRNTRSSQLASSPLFYQSSPANDGPSSPLRHNTESQSQSHADPGAAPSSPLRHMTNSQTTRNESQNDGDRTPRASGAPLVGGMYLPAVASTRRETQLTPWQSLLPFDMSPAPARDEPWVLNPTCGAKAAISLWVPGTRQGPGAVDEATSTRRSSAAVLDLAAGSCWTKPVVLSESSTRTPPLSPISTPIHRKLTSWVVSAMPPFGERPFRSRIRMLPSRTS